MVVQGDTMKCLTVQHYRMVHEGQELETLLTDNLPLP